MKRPVASSKTRARWSFLLKSKSKVSRVLSASRKRACPPACEQAILPPDQFVADECGDEIERREPLGLCLTEPGFERVGYPGEPKLAERTIKFGECHSESPVRRGDRADRGRG
jgi:hypothetical protein